MVESLMTRVHVLPLGSLDPTDLSVRCYAVSVDGGRPRGQCSSAGDDAALATIARNAPGAELTCALELAGAAAGFHAEPWSKLHRQQGATLAVRHALGLPFLKVNDDAAIVRLIEAAARLASVHVADLSIRARFTQQGSTSLLRARASGALVLTTGAAPSEIALDVFGSETDRDAYLVASNDPEADLPEVAHATLHLVEGAPGLRDAMTRFTGQSLAPAPLVHEVDPRGLDDIECRWLAAVTFAAAELLAHRDETEVVSVFADAELELGTRLFVDRGARTP